MLKAQLGRRRLRLDDEQRRRLAVLGDRLGRRLLREFATLVTPDTILRWHRELVARSGRTHVSTQDDRGCRKRFDGSSTDNPQWGYTRIQGALKNVGHRVAGSTIACILKAEGLPPRDERSTAWNTFLRAHWPALVAADFFTTDVGDDLTLELEALVFGVSRSKEIAKIVGHREHAALAILRCLRI